MDDSTISEGHSIQSCQNSTFIFNENLNIEFLSATYGNNLSFGAKMFGIFLRTIDQDLAILQDSVTELDFESIKAIAHKIKNNYTWVGLPALSQMTYEVENMAREESKAVIPKIEELLLKSRETYPHVKQQFYALQAAA